MKQITLEHSDRSSGLCFPRILLVWGLLGYALAWLSSLGAESLSGRIGVWILSIVAGIAIAKEI
jgi:hypothetical protein